MSVTIPLSAVLGAVLAAAVLFFVRRWIESARRTFEAATAATVSATNALVGATAALTQVRDALAPAAGELQANMAAVPKILEMISKIGGAQLEIMQAQRGPAQPPQAPFRPNGHVPQRDVNASNLEWEVQQMMRVEPGLTREEALMRMNGANQNSVWSGNAVLDGWGG